MDKIVITGIDAYNGEYDADFTRLSNKDLHTIKRISGVRAGELEEAMDAGDSDILVALAMIAVGRSGRPLVEDLFWQADAGSILYVGGGKDDAVPPTVGVQPTPEPSSESGENDSSSSGDSENTSARSVTIP